MKRRTLQFNGKLFVLEKPVVMGILNATPDSFYTLPSADKNHSLVAQAEQMIEDGATLLDIGGMSTRPNSKLISIEEEWNRIEAPLKAIRKKLPEAILSIDTFRAEIARRAALEGANIINDISAGSMDEKMLATVGQLNLPYIAMHMQGTPQTMQNNPQYNHVVRDIVDYFIKKTAEIQAAGITDIILDPGFGFGKTLQQNYQLLNGFDTLQLLDKPLLAGISRKSMIYKLLQVSPKEALNATTALHMIALQKGADILRVHDVKEAIECIQLWEYTKNT